MEVVTPGIGRNRRRSGLGLTGFSRAMESKTTRSPPYEFNLSRKGLGKVSKKDSHRVRIYFGKDSHRVSGRFGAGS